MFYVCNNDALVFGLVDEINKLSKKAERWRNGFMLETMGVESMMECTASEVEGQTFF